MAPSGQQAVAIWAMFERRLRQLVTETKGELGRYLVERDPGSHPPPNPSPDSLAPVVVPRPGSFCLAGCDAGSAPFHIYE